MAVILEVKAGPFAGKRVAVVGGQTVTIGRTTRANFAIPHDTFMSGVHFAVEFGPKGCVLTDQKSSNGTFVNGAKVTQVPLNGGDEVRSGQTVFVVRIVDEEPLPTAAKVVAPAVKPLPLPIPLPARPTERTTPLDQPEYKVRPAAPASLPNPVAIPGASARPLGKPLLKIGSWTFSTLPDQWAAQGEYGIQRDAANVFPSSAVATEEPLGNGISLQEYVEAQLAMLRQYLREPQIDAALPPKILGAEETVAVDVHYKTKDGQAVFYRRVYARVGKIVGVLTFTTVQNELSHVAPAFDAIASGAGFAPATNAQA
ncbi:MAG TPA: FHA domain-containing protein [Candidatus Acidoferrales bacterium]|nr:FHA domain-containing protein [Candidatus Acidoferrales bacterium]